MYAVVLKATFYFISMMCFFKILWYRYEQDLEGLTFIIHAIEERFSEQRTKIVHYFCWQSRTEPSVVNIFLVPRK